MITIPIQPVPNQLVKCVLGGNEVIITLTQSYNGLNCSINSNGFDISLAVIARNATPLNSRTTDNFTGYLFLVDTQGDLDPYPSGLGSRFLLVYSEGGQ